MLYYRLFLLSLPPASPVSTECSSLPDLWVSMSQSHHHFLKPSLVTGSNKDHIQDGGTGVETASTMQRLATCVPDASAQSSAL